MLEIIAYLKPFFEDCYRRVNVREYARIMGISPPTASKLLNDFARDKLLMKDAYKNYILFYANKESGDFIDLSRLYWRRKLVKITEMIGSRLVSPLVVLFGSLSKAEVKEDSDVDLAVFGGKKQIDLSLFEKNIRRDINVLWFESFADLKNKELGNNIINGYVLRGRIFL
ncbi:MAG: nucleotidyltransferase domain-containing protein [Candidatus Aenigmarchaeota archaeon]|nr:nucleotidyltransferase domain-containing protein [Candidatus Aenigmarchaeota archaeon]